MTVAPDGSWFVLTGGNAAGEVPDGDGDDGGGVAVVLALGDAVTVPLPGAGELLLAWDPTSRVGDGVVELPADGVALVRVTRQVQPGQAAR